MAQTENLLIQQLPRATCKRLLDQCEPFELALSAELSVRGQPLSHAYLKDVRKRAHTQPANRIAEWRPHRWQPSATTCSKSHAVVKTGSPRACERSTNQKEILMLKTITATYASKTTVANVVDELVNGGIPREKIYSDDTTMQVKVMVPETGVPGIEEILNRHEPTSIS